MSKEKFALYAPYYDILYRDKNYRDETRFISELIKKFVPKDKVSILDLACGTGRHAMELSELGYNVEGSDLSDEMIKIAVAESKKRNLDINYYNESFQTCGGIGKKYDVVISMFSSINYLITYDNLRLAFKNIYSLLNDGGVFIFDFWNGNAVVKDFSPVRVKRASDGSKDVLRISETTIDRISQTTTTKFSFMLFENNVLTKEFKEEHTVRYFFLQEAADFLKINNLEVVFRCPFMDISRDISPFDWNVTYVVRKAV